MAKWETASPPVSVRGPLKALALALAVGLLEELIKSRTGYRKWLNLGELLKS